MDMSLSRIFPAEVILHVLSYLSPIELTKCRGVCRIWRETIDDLLDCDAKWRKICVDDFKQILSAPRIMVKNGLSYFELYRSLFLMRNWPSMEPQERCILEAKGRDEIGVFQIIKKDLIGIITSNFIVYYDFDGNKVEKDFFGSYNQYVEDEDMMAVQTIEGCAVFSYKIEYFEMKAYDVTHAAVIFITLNERVGYFVDAAFRIYACEANEATERVEVRYICNCLEPVMCISYTDKLNILTKSGNIYAYERSLVLVQRIELNVIEVLYEYQFIQHVNWRIVSMWQSIPGKRYYKEISYICLYGDYVFVGSNWGVVLLYKMCKNFVPVEAIPIKRWDLDGGRAVDRSSAVIKIEVVAMDYGHIVFMNTMKKLVAFEFVHDELFQSVEPSPVVSVAETE